MLAVMKRRWGVPAGCAAGLIVSGFSDGAALFFAGAMIAWISMVWTQAKEHNS